jgi:hypothetical protein
MSSGSAQIVLPADLLQEIDELVGIGAREPSSSPASRGARCTVYGCFGSSERSRLAGIWKNTPN